jgi:hypothetical protein
MGLWRRREVSPSHTLIRQENSGHLIGVFSLRCRAEWESWLEMASGGKQVSESMPEPVRKVATWLLITTVGLAFVSTVSVLVFVLSILHVFHAIGLSVYWQSEVSVILLFLLCASVRYGWVRRKRWAYYLVRIFFFPSLLDELFSRDRNPDWVTRQFKDPQTIEWFFGEKQ